MLTKRILTSIAFAVMVFSGAGHTDDTELYVYESSARSGARPQVLIIFDNSGSMGNMVDDAEAFYDPSITYPAVGSDNSLQERMVYFTKGGIDNTAMPVPDSPSESRRFLSEINGCETSWDYLQKYGVFTGFFREYSFSGQNGTWQEVPDNNGANITHIDCFDDIEGKKWRNAPGQPSGFPIDSTGNKKNPIRYAEVNGSSSDAEIDAAYEKAKQTAFGTGQPITLYTDNYLRWYHGDQESVPKSRLAIAKEVIKNTIVTTPSVDFGLAIFNINYPYEGYGDGGRIVSGIKEMSEANKLSLLSTIDSLPASTNTPLCETLYEAYRYFSGRVVYFGRDDISVGSLGYKKNIPPRDISIESGGKYISPFKECQNRAYVVYITDGVPTLDHNADHKVLELSGITSADQFVNSSPSFTSYLPALAGWMNTNDVNTSENAPDEQNVTTFTIGFSEGADDAADLLLKTAEKGGGKYFPAANASALQSALQQVFSQILEVNASFTSPSIASNNFDRTRTFDSVYYSMFLPNKGPRWSGNLKKFRVTGDGDIVDKNGVNALGSDGNLISSACSYWTENSVCAAASDGGDGNDVKVGGVAEVLRKTTNRKLLSNIGSNGAMASFTKSNASNYAGGDASLAAYMGVDETQLDGVFNWTKGQDVDDDNGNLLITDTRADILGDPLHSRPLAINFGSELSPDIRILMGTNHGFLHMFKDSNDTVSESWAFMPYELLPNLRELKANVPTGVHSVYGLDSSPVSYVKTGASGLEKAWVFIGMRRGGKSYYGFDVTTPDSPRFMWKIDSNSSGMAELAQSWSEPVVTHIPGWPTGNSDPTKAKPVLIFGAGYSPSTKDGAAVGINDTEGRGVFIVDAETGTLVHSFGPSASSNVTQLPGITDSIPNSVAVLDSNNDKLSDRIYASDTGGNVWRIDLPSAYPKDAKNPWTAFKFADLGGGTQASDRRFFAEPTVAQTIFTNLSEVSVTVDGTTTTTKTYQNIPYDAVALGTGHRPHPSDKLRQDKLFTLQDRNVVTRSYNGLNGNTIPSPIMLADLYDITSKAATTESENITFGKKLGWFYSLGATGEKSLAGASIIQGRVYFTSYVPGDTSSSNQCLIAGMGRLYSFALHKGTRTYTQEYIELGERVPDTPPPLIPPGGDGNIYFPIPEAEMKPCEEGDVNCPPPPCENGNDKCVGGALGVNRIYYHVNE
ncbi:rRNA (guanine-N1)-methyltransferase [Shewanella schlegeliana]|uniref:rRNA (Guanine-N1)-methyltransferase n=1 Tax=Shewanella schlegeliana TaxID=190308 RepID=A0ABS1SUC0_9GAMM|nr:PilC/PilY family type IV pilus protein [Shewanella schlegeliana]MBL4912128.1 rRNA (guanine-N1)-methyltransferase [Shewanella schlegeliana]MCL1110786.1 rRNA (guanine-N1)-methyltransferase [Shewanella schlegeliana]GIU22930.1 type IV pili system adhesin PilY [Shewanella schlegeliana]